ncbi:MAG TPA: DUF6798 domain-containing protein [Bryobacteraceae bacterium]|nr:DUF6798 domain-containing protein [Bryobacteraceae bacterium]
MRHSAWALAALLALTAIGFLYFPGHTYLQSDTQIYIPILERLNDSTLFSKEIIAQKPHVSFTMYDEAALWLRRLTGLGFREVLTIQQIVFRFAALLGVYFLATALKLSPAAAVLVAACYSLGASINGPSVLTFEYEPVPRGNAIGLTMLAIGLLAQGRHLWAGCAAAVALLYHLPAVYPYWIAYFVLALIPSTSNNMSKHLKGLLPMAAGVLVLLILSRLQVGEGEHQRFFATIDSAHEQMMRERASYNWVSLWPVQIFWHYAVLLACLGASIWRLRNRLPSDLRIIAMVAPVIGILSMPLSYLLLERMKWSLIPQIQPMRALLYVTAFTVIFCACAGVAAAQERRWGEAAGWLFIALLPPVSTRAIPYLFEARNLRTLLTALAAALVVTAASRWQPSMLAAAFAMPFLIPLGSGVVNYPPLHHAELDELSRWARTSTPKDSVFLFPDAEKALHPGVFRAESLRTVYADWKGGGQINFLREFLTVWLPRWKQTVEPEFIPGHLERYRPLGIDYVVVFQRHEIKGATPIFRNGKYSAYAVP